MGKVVSKSEQLNKAQSLISCATERQQDVYNVMMALESFASDSELTGKAYKNAKGYIQSIYSPICKALCMALEDEITANKTVVDCCNTYLAEDDLLDEDTILSEIDRLQRENNELQDDWWDLLPIVKDINLERIENNNSQIDKLNKHLQNLYDFDSATQGLHAAADSQMSIVSQKISDILSPAIFSEGRFHYSGIDMSWANDLVQRWDNSAHSAELKEDYQFVNIMEKSYGFSPEQSFLLRKAYVAVENEYGDSLDNIELANKFWGMIATLCVNYDGKRWHMAANTDSYSDVVNQLKELGLTEQEILDLTVMINRQHGQISNDEFEEKGIEVSNSKYANITHDDYRNASEGYHKDFVHEAIELAIFSNEIDSDDISLRGAFELLFTQKGAIARGVVDIINTSFETGRVYTKYEASFKGDIDSGRCDDSDIASDMDAISVYYNISQKGEDPFDALVQYNLDIESGDKNRAVEFLKAIGDGSEGIGWVELLDVLDATTMGSEHIRGGKSITEDNQHFMNILIQEYQKEKGI